MALTENREYSISKREFTRRFTAQVQQDALNAHLGSAENPWFGTCEDGAFRLYYKEAKLSGSFPMVLKGSVVNRNGGIAVDCEYRQLPIRKAAPVIIALMWFYVLYTGAMWFISVAAVMSAVLVAFAIMINPKKRQQALREKLDKLCQEAK